MFSALRNDLRNETRVEMAGTKKGFFRTDRTVIDARGGNDRIHVHQNIDGSVKVTINGKDHNFTAAQARNMIIDGGRGDDTITMSGHQLYGPKSNISIVGGKGNDTIYGSCGDDKIHGGKGDDRIYGGGGNDYLTGDRGADRIYGGSGNDTIRGGKHEDYLNGGSGNDRIYGDKGHDTLVGGPGCDHLDGGRGDDQLNYGVDRIPKFCMLNHISAR